MSQICHNQFIFVVAASVAFQGFSTAGNSWAAEPVQPARVDRFGDPLPDRAIARFGSVRLHDYFGLHCVEFTPDGKSLATGGGSGVAIWSLSDGRKLTGFASPLPVRAIKFSPDSRLLGVQTENGVAISPNSPAAPVRPVDLGKGELLGFTRDSKHVILNAGNAIRVVDAVSGRDVEKFSYKPGSHKACSFNAATGTVAFVDDSGQLVVATIGAGNVPRLLRKATKGEYTSLAISDDGSRLACLVERDAEDNPSWEEDGGYVDVIDIGSGNNLFRLRAALRADTDGLRLRFSPDSSLLAASSESSTPDEINSNNTIVIRIADGKKVARLPCVRSLYSPDGKLLVGVQGSGVGLWRTTTWERCFAEFGQGSSNFAMAISPDERRLATADRDFLLMWEIDSAKQLWRQDLAPYHGFGNPLAFSADGETLFVNRSKHIEVLNSATGDKMRSYSIGPFDAASPDGSSGIHWENEGFRLQHLTGSPRDGFLSGFTNETNRTGVAISPDSRLIVGTGILKLRPNFQNRLVFWRISTGEQVFSEDSQSRAETHPSFLGDQLLVTHWHNPKGWEHPDLSLIIRETFTGGICDEIPIGDIELNSLIGGAVGPDAWVAIANGPDDQITPDKPGVTIIQNVFASGEAMIMDQIPRYAQQAFFLRSRRCLLCLHSGEILVWQLASTGKLGQDVPLDAPVFERLWNDLAADSRTAWSAIKRLRNAGDAAIPFLKGRVSIAPVPMARVQSLVREDQQADSDEARRRARDDITALGTAATALVERLRSEVPSQRVRDDLDFALDRWSSPIISDPVELRRMRTILLLELIGTDDAARLLATIAGGPQGARETLAARRAFQRYELRLAAPQH